MRSRSHDGRLVVRCAGGANCVKRGWRVLGWCDVKQSCRAHSSGVHIQELTCSFQTHIYGLVIYHLPFIQGCRPPTLSPKGCSISQNTLNVL